MTGRYFTLVILWVKTARMRHGGWGARCERSSLRQDRARGARLCSIAARGRRRSRPSCG